MAKKYHKWLLIVCNVVLNFALYSEWGLKQSKLLTQVGYFELTEGQAVDVYVVDDCAYIAAGSGGIVILDVSDPAQPKFIKQYTYSTSCVATDIFVHNNYAYVIDIDSGLIVIDVSDKLHPRRVSKFTLNNVHAMYIKNEYAYIGTSDGLHIINISDPQHPVRVGYYNTPSIVAQLYVSNNYAYLANWDAGFYIMDVIDPESPNVVAHIDIDSVCGVSIYGNHAYVIGYRGGLYVIDISQPTAPKKIGEYKGFNNYHLMEVEAISYRMILVSCTDGNLYVLDVSHPTSIIEADRYNCGYGLTIFVHNRYVYVPQYKGLLILKLKQTLPPRYPPSLVATAIFSDESGNNNHILDSNEDAQIIVKVANESQWHAVDLRMKVTPLNEIRGVIIRSPTVVFDVPPNKYELIYIPVSGDKHLATGTARFKIEVLEPYFGADANPIELSFETRGTAPEFMLTGKFIEDGEVNLGKFATLRLQIANKGGTAHNVRVTCTTAKGVTMFDEHDMPYFKTYTLTVGEFKSGETHDIRLKIFVSKRFTLDKVLIEMRINSDELETTLSTEFMLGEKASVLPATVLVRKRHEKVRYPPQLVADVRFCDSLGNNNNVLEADETAEIIVEVKNLSKWDAYNLRLSVTPLENAEGIKYTNNIPIDTLPGNSQKTVCIPIIGQRTMSSGIAKLRIDVLEPYFGADANPIILSFATKEFVPPDVIIYDKAVKEGEIVPGRSATLVFIVQNKGGLAKNVEISFSGPTGVTLFDLDGLPKDTCRFIVGDLGEMEWQEIELPIFLSKRYQKDSLTISIYVKEERPEFNKKLIETFPVYERIPTPKEISILPKERQKKYIPPPVLTSDVDRDIPHLHRQNPYSVAVIIGIKNYQKTVPVDYAHNDAFTMKKYLMNVLGYPEENIIFELDATQGVLMRIFGDAEDYKGELYNLIREHKSDVFIYYVGHGAPDIDTKEAYLVPADCDPNYVKLNGYPLSLFYKNLSKLPAKNITVVIDACFSGCSEHGMLVASASPLVPTLIEEKKPASAVIFTASTGDQIASWYPDQAHSLFTYYFLKGLRGEADHNADRKITCGELYDYVREEVKYYAKRLFGREQTPTFWGDRNRILVEY